jgi:threonine dehydratase
VIQQHVRELFTVTDAEMIAAIRLALLRAKILIEPSGAAGLAAALAGHVRRYSKVGVVISGGNIDPDMLVRFLEEGELKIESKGEAPLRTPAAKLP